MYTRRLSRKCLKFNKEKSTIYQRPQWGKKKPQKGKYLFETEDLNEANRPQGQEDQEQ